MKGMLIVGVLLVVFGAFVLAYPAITYTTEEEVLDIGPIEATAETEKSIPLHPALGGVSLAGGVLLIVMGLRQPGSGVR
jgi:hypothetical protein